MRRPSCTAMSRSSPRQAGTGAEVAVTPSRQIHMEEGVTILLVEQNARKALGIADYGYILETGKIAIQDTAAALRENEQVRAAYLGGGHVRATASQP